MVFLPVLPMAAVGLSLSARHSMFAALSACATIALLSDVGYILFFALFIVLPMTHFVRKCLLWRGEETAKEWYPALAALAEMTLLAAGVFMVFALTSVNAEHIELKTVLAGALSGQPDNPLEGSDPTIANYIKLLVNQWSFLVFAGGKLDMGLADVCVYGAGQYAACGKKYCPASELRLYAAWAAPVVAGNSAHQRGACLLQ